MANKKNIYKIEIATGVILLIGIIAISIFVLPKICLNTLFSENTGLYLYSALVQSNAALFSILAIFIIFRLQHISSSIISIRSELTNISPKSAQNTRSFFDQKSSESRMKLIESTLGIDDYYIKQLYKNIDSYLNEQEKIKTIPLRPMTILLLIIMFQVVLLLLSNSIHTIGVMYEASVFVFVIILQALALMLILKNIKKMI